MQTIMTTYGILLIAIGIMLAIFEAADPGFFIAIPAGVLITLGFIILAFPDMLLTPWTPLIVALVVIPLMFISMRYYQYISPPSKPTTSTPTSLKGREGKVVKEIDPDDISGKVRVGSKYWSATADERIEEGAKVKIVEGKGVHVVVKKIE